MVKQSKSFLNFFQKNIVKRKVKEVIKEENEEKDSLFNEIKIKSQAAMEYLMTYGWAILIIALVLGVLYSLGIMNPKNFLPRAPPGSCFVFRPNGPGTTDFVSLQGTCGYLPMYVASFNGVNSYVDVPNSANLSPSQLTVVVWVKNTMKGTTTYDRLILSKYTSSYSVKGYSLTWGWSSDFYWRAGNGTNCINLVYITLPYGDKWYHIAATFKNGEQKLYVNGVLQGSNTLTFDIVYDSSDLYIGKNPGNYRLQGIIANVQIYNAVLTQQEIQYLYQQGLGGGPIRLGSLVGWWPLNGDAKDYSGNNNHGTIYNVTFVQNYNPP